MFRRFRAFARLSGWERNRLLAAFVTLFEIEIALRRHGFQHVLQRIEVLEVRGDVHPEDCQRAALYARWIDRAARYHLLRARCLHRSLALHAWLRRDGLPSTLRLGVRKDGNRIQAHAWVELDGVIVNDGSGVRTDYAQLRHPA